MTYNPKKKEYNLKYSQKTYEQIRFQTRKDLHFKERIKQGAIKRDMSINDYIFLAVNKQLEIDNIPEYTPDQQNPD